MTSSRARLLRRGILVAIVLILIVIYLFPVYWMVSTSFKVEKDYFSWPPKWLPNPLTLEHYRVLFGPRNMLFYFRNSLIISVTSVALCLVSGSLASYALAKFRFQGNVGKNVAMWILSLRMMPPIAVAIPIFILFGKMHLIDTQLGLILAYVFFNLPFVVWMMYGFFAEIPPEVEEAGMVDGCGRFGVFWRIAVPLAAPGLAATAIFAMVMSWNEFLFASKLTAFNANTMPVLISSFITDRGLLWGEMSAAGTIASLPMVVMSLFVQRYLVRGLTLGAVK